MEVKCASTLELPSPVLSVSSVGQGCSMYKDSACCSKEVYNKLESTYNERHQHKEDCPACSINLRNLECAIHCSPLQGLYMSPASSVKQQVMSKVVGQQGANVKKDTMVFKVCESYCDALYYSCGSVSTIFVISLLLPHDC
jgi:hypothetical protein